VQHSTGGYLLHAALTTAWTFDLKADDVSGAPPISAGHRSQLHHLRPAGAGAPRSCSRGVPTYPDAARFWKMIEKHKVSIFYTGANGHPIADQVGRGQPRVTLTRATCPACASWHGGRAHNPRLGVVLQARGAAAAAPSSTTFWQTETGGHVITPLPAPRPMVAGS